MTASNSNFRKSTKYTVFAVALAVVALGGVGYLWHSVQALDHQFGALVRDRVGYEKRLEQVKAEVDTEQKKLDTAWNEREAIRKRTAEANAQLQQIKSSVGAAEDGKSQLEIDIVGLKKELEELKGQRDQAKSDIVQAQTLRAESVRLRNQKQALQSDLEKAQGDLDALKGQQDNAQEQLNQTNAKIASTKRMLKSLEDEAGVQNASIETLRARVAGLQADQQRKKDLEAESEKLTSENSKAEDNLEAVKKAIASQSAEKERLKAEVADLATKAASLVGIEKRLADARSALASVQQKQRDAEQAQQQAEAVFTALTPKLSQKQKDLEDLGAQIAATKSELQSRRQELEELAGRKGMLAQRIEAEKQNEESAKRDAQNAKAEADKDRAAAKDAKERLAEVRAQLITTSENYHAVLAQLADAKKRLQEAAPSAEASESTAGPSQAPPTAIDVSAPPGTGGSPSKAARSRK